MDRFSLKKIDNIKGKIVFHKLIIDDCCEFDDFCEELENHNETNDLIRIFATMESIANLNRLPKTKFRELQGRKKSDNIKDYEIKSNDYRVYLFKCKNGNIVVFGGIKKNQTKDINRLRQIKLTYNERL